MELALWQSETHCDELAKTSFAHPPAYIELSSQSIHWNTHQSQAIELDRFEFITLNYLDSSGIDRPLSPSHSHNRLKPP
ncbi:hypothetical protein BSZ32_16105 [Rubritalea profundi]|uniref:Uncharacterized protein n=1 Tax=Rubritalea profundi TaxID=1658618 RepID=A0A2S7U4A9_9BACT|nr:hypothetical protein BSZ32_16105 [Rubritalea profundi]